MTKYLIIALTIIILIMIIYIIFFSSKNSSVKTNPPPSAEPNQNNLTFPQNMPIQDQIKLQEQADRDFTEQSKQLDNSYPWLDKLPIQSTNYFVYFNTDQKQFIGKIYPQKSSNIPIDQQGKNYQQEIITKLQNLIPDYSKYNINWVIQPE